MLKEPKFMPEERSLPLPTCGRSFRSACDGMLNCCATLARTEAMLVLILHR